MTKKIKKYISINIFFVSIFFCVLFSHNNSVYAALEPILVKDVNAIQSGGVGSLTSYNGEVIFTAYDDYKGSELWKSDGTEAGTVMIKDIREGLTGSGPANLIVFGENVFFTANNGINGIELWKSDGTEVGTVMIKDIRAGSLSSSPENLFVLGETLYFTATNGTNGKELWKSDGTDTGTVMVKDIRSGSSGGMDSFSSTCRFAAMNGFIYFSATNGTNGYELWKSDGTDAGTSMVKDIWVGSSSGASPSYIYENLVVIGNTLYFPAITSANGLELWKSDGTNGGTLLVKDINVGSTYTYLAYFVEFNGLLYFRANSSQLWKSDGTDAGTIMVKDIDIHPDYSTYLNKIYVIGSTLYFGGDDGYLGYELWKSDGTESGTVMVKDIYEGVENSSPDRFIEFLGVTYFSAEESVHGQELWTTNGTEVGTTLFKDIYVGSNSSYPSDLLVMGNVMYFTSEDEHGEELWVTDGTVGGTVMVKEISISTDESNPQFFGVTDSYLYFMADDGIHGYELWKTDGTQEGTVLVKDIYPGDSDCFFSSTEMYGVGDTLYFLADDGVHGEELWISDGTEAGTIMVKDINPGEGDSYPYEYASIGNIFIFAADDGINGTELWRSDGTEAGTVMVKDIYSGADGSLYSEYGLTLMGDYLYFRAEDDTHGVELWRTDGTLDGTTLVKDIYPGSAGGSPDYLYNLNGELFFSAYDSEHGGELWRSDGTGAGTYMVKDIYVGTSSSYPSRLSSNGNILYFSANDGINGKELWRSNGTEGGTYMVKDISTGAGSSSIWRITSMGNIIYFQAYNESLNYELWRSDGTEPGTYIVKEINSLAGSYPDYFTLLGDEIYFSANDGVNGKELWKSDGSAGGTILVKDLFVGVGNSSPVDLTTFNGTIFFNACSILNDCELWMLGNSFQKSNFNPSSGSTITTPTPSISFNTSDTGSCRLSLTDESYDNMSDNVICSGSGTTSHTCISPDLGSSGTKNIYISCSNDVDYEDSSSTNTNLVYTYDSGTPEEEEEEEEEEDEEVVISPSVKITKIGYLTSIPDSSYLQYFYSSRSVNIQGVATTGSTVKFTVNSKVYTTTADESGKFSITLYLSEGINTIEYISKDILNNESTKRILKLIISETEELIVEEEEITEEVPPVENIDNDVPEKDIPPVTQEPEEKKNLFGEKVRDFIRGITITEKQSKDIAVGSLISLPLLATLSLAFGNTYIGALLIRVFSYILALFKIGKKKRNCGLVYNSVTKEPLGMAIVRIFSKEGRLVATEVTNQYGIFESSLPSDTYKLDINMNGYVFPSSLIAGNQDLPYRNIYTGGDFNLSNHPISYSVPVDPLNKSVLQEIKTVVRNRFINISISLINIVILIGLLFSVLSYIKVPNTFNLALLILYILTLVITIVMNSQGKYRFGTVRDIYEERLEGVELSLMETEFGTNFARRITDEKGKYRFIVPGGEYKLVSTDPDYNIMVDRESIFKGKKDKVMVISNNLIARKR